MMRQSSLLERDLVIDNFLEKMEALERRVAELERWEIMKFGDADGSDYAEFDADGMITFNGEATVLFNFGTETFKLVDAGSAAATEQDWIEVKVEGNTGYIRVFAAK